MTGGSQPPIPLPGGYTSQDPNSAAMRALLIEAERLLQAKYPNAGLRLSAITQAESQVVAGANYRLEANYSDTRGMGKITLILYRNLQGQYSLTQDDYKP